MLIRPVKRRGEGGGGVGLVFLLDSQGMDESREEKGWGGVVRVKERWKEERSRSDEGDRYS